MAEFFVRIEKQYGFVLIAEIFIGGSVHRKYVQYANSRRDITRSIARIIKAAASF
jgi:hypothetical protein